MKIKVFSTSKHPLPAYATIQSAGLDLRANIEKTITLSPNERCLIQTGLHIQLPIGYEAQIRPRSGMALKKGVYAILGTIDSDYRGDIGVILYNNSNEPFVINDGDRIAQMVISKYEMTDWEPVESHEELDVTKRGTEGYGHTGTK